MKKVCWFLIVVLLLGCFAGCQQLNPGAKGPIQNEDGTLSDWMKEEIAQRWTDVIWYEENPMVGTRYYGTENGYVFLFSYGIACSEKTLVIGEYRFYCASDFDLFAYKDGKFSYVKDLYADGVLSDACIEKIYNIHNRYGSR